MMYLDHFGLSRAPFRITPDLELFHSGANRGAVLEALKYAIEQGEGIVKVVGEVGSGKTMLARVLADQLPSHCSLAFLAHPNIGPDEAVRALAYEFGFDVNESLGKISLTQRLYDYLVAQHAQGRRAVLFVEEAQGMPRETLEEVRLLSNLETGRDKLLQIVLFGQPELDQTLSGHDMRQLRERITCHFELAPFSRDEVTAYLDARLRACGYRGGPMFSAGALTALAKASEGLLRRVNVLADKSLLAAFAEGGHRVELRHVRRAIRDAGLDGPHRRHPSVMTFGPRLLGAAIIAGLAVAIIGSVATDGGAAWSVPSRLLSALRQSLAGLF